MLKSWLYRLFERLARALGILDIQARLDQIDGRHREVLDRLNNLENSQEKLFQALFEQSENAKEVIPMIQAVDRLNETRTRKLILDSKLEQEHQMTTQVRTLMDELLIQFRRDLDGLRAVVKSAQIVEGQTPLEPHTKHTFIDDALYVSLEDRFRGEVAEISERQRQYLPYVASIASSSTPVLDLGCGRGEWLHLLMEEGIPSKGIDSNFSAVAECLRLGLEVNQSELLSALSNTPSQSIGAITMFQVLEHLPFDLVIEVLRESLRVLVPGGVFIGEIPNCETLRVGASTFWIDPTHQRPLYPAVLEFLARQVGFKSVEGKYSSPLAPELNLDGVPNSIASTLQDLHHKINGPGDFALIATA